MILDSTLRRLRWHADLEELPDGGVPSVSSCLRPGAIDASALESALSDFVAALEILNHELNGAMPDANKFLTIVITLVLNSLPSSVDDINYFAACDPSRTRAMSPRSLR